MGDQGLFFKNLKLWLMFPPTDPRNMGQSKRADGRDGSLADEMLSVVYVRWTESETVLGWAAPDEITIKPSDILTAGILVDDSMDWLVIAQSIDPSTGFFKGLSFIPRSSVKDLKVLWTIQTIQET